MRLLDEVQFQQYIQPVAEKDDLQSYLFKLQAEFDESKHPREPAGDEKSGEFISVGGGGTATGQFPQHAALLKAFGFKQTGVQKGPNPAHPEQTSVLKSTWEHPQHGKVEVDHMAHTFVHTPAGAQPISGPAGKKSIALEQHLRDYGKSGEQAPAPSPKPVEKPKEAPAPKVASPEPVVEKPKAAPVETPKAPPASDKSFNVKDVEKEMYDKGWVDFSKLTAPQAAEFMISTGGEIYNKGGGVSSINPLQPLQGDNTKRLSDDQRQAYLDQLPQMIQKMKRASLTTYYSKSFDDFTEPELEKLADGLDATKSPSKGTMDAQDSLWMYTKNYGVFQRNVFSKWSKEGGGDTYTGEILRQGIQKAFPSTDGTKFYQPKDKWGSKPPSPTNRFVENLKLLKKETESYYAGKLDQPVTVYRGIPNPNLGNVYTPAALESWTTDRSVANDFSYKDDNNGKLGKVLTTTVTYGDLLMDYKTAKKGQGWEKDYMSEKEAVVLGGRIKNVTIKNSTKKTKW